MVLLNATGITKSFAGVQALKGVSFELRSGEVHAVVGENGAGKSTLIKIITGAVKADSGALTVEGQAVAHHSPALAHSLGIAVVYQQPALFPDLTVAENIGLALESTKRQPMVPAATPHESSPKSATLSTALQSIPGLLTNAFARGGAWRRIDWQARERLARELLDRAGAEIEPQRKVHTLSMPEQQIVEIAKAIGAQARILILDEPTASLTDREVERLFRVIGTLRASGTGIIYISHRLEEIATIADRVTVLRDGQTVATRELSDVKPEELIRLMVGRDIQAIFPKREVPIGEVVFETRNLACRATGIRGINLTVRRGEILGLAGLIGAGRTQLAETLFGLAPADGGEIRVHGQSVVIRSPGEAIRMKIGYLPEDRRQHGVVLQMPVAANASVANLGAVSHYGLVNGREERRLTRRYVERLRIKTPSLETETGSLSGGNQQKVALARWLAIEPEVLILDEPTQGVDIGAKSEIHQMMVELAEQGMAIIMISSELPEILGMSDRIVVMRGGTVAGNLARAEATQERILALALGHA